MGPLEAASLTQSESAEELSRIDNSQSVTREKLENSLEAAKDSAGLNASAAQWTAASVGLAAVAVILTAIQNLFFCR